MEGKHGNLKSMVSSCGLRTVEAAPEPILLNFQSHTEATQKLKLAESTGFQKFGVPPRGTRTNISNI